MFHTHDVSADQKKKCSKLNENDDEEEEEEVIKFYFHLVPGTVDDDCIKQ